MVMHAEIALVLGKLLCESWARKISSRALFAFSHESMLPFRPHLVEAIEAFCFCVPNERGAS
jgi:hypothetical protein